MTGTAELHNLVSLNIKSMYCSSDLSYLITYMHYNCLSNK